MKKKKADIPWQQIYDFVYTCGQVHDPYQFMVTVLDEIGELVPYDQGIAWTLDENRKVVAQHLVNMKPRWANMYLAYYSQLQTTSHTFQGSANESFGMPFVQQISWDSIPDSEFKFNYIMARGVKCSLTFVLFDLNSLPRAVFSLDRMITSRFSDEKMEVLRFAVAQLGNLYKNFFTKPEDIPGKRKSDTYDVLAVLLTNREREVVDLMCQGLSPAHVASTLHITTSTAYKHIAHIYKKLHVSSQQELLVRVLGNK